MSNALAVPTVTAALTCIVQNAVDRLGLTPGPVVAPGPLDDAGDNGRVGVHLYRITRNADLSVTDLPTRSPSGDLRRLPRAALDLHYLFTFRGNSEWESQQLLAKTAAALHSESVISTPRIEQAENDHPEVAGNDLASADEPVRVCSDMLSIDELTRLWALYSPGSFSVTLGVLAGPVLVDSDGDVGAGLPVHRVVVGAAPFDAPRLDSVAGPDGVGAPVRAASPIPDLRLRGNALGARVGESVEVLVDGLPVPGVGPVDDSELVLAAPALSPGAHRVRVRRVGAPLDASASTTPTTVQSEVVTVLVVPTLGAVTKSTAAGSSAGLRTGTVTAGFQPAVGHTHRVRLLLDSSTTEPAVALSLDADFPTGNAAHKSLDFPVIDAPAGEYRVTLEIDGARSLPPVDANDHYVLPVVTL